MPIKIGIHSVEDMNVLLEKHDWPAEMFLPAQTFDFIYFRGPRDCWGREDGIPFIWFSGTKLWPPKHPKRVGIVDLSEAVEE